MVGCLAASRSMCVEILERHNETSIMLQDTQRKGQWMAGRAAGTVSSPGAVQSHGGCRQLGAMRGPHRCQSRGQSRYTSRSTCRGHMVTGANTSMVLAAHGLPGSTGSLRPGSPAGTVLLDPT